MSEFESIKCDSCGKSGAYSKMTSADKKTTRVICRMCFDSEVAALQSDAEKWRAHVASISDTATESAFPHDNQELGNRHRVAQPGMSLRDWFAGQAIAGMNSAEQAYSVADAMLAERAKSPK